jgi:hypothetical protein
MSQLALHLGFFGMRVTLLLLLHCSPPPKMQELSDCRVHVFGKDWKIFYDHYEGGNKGVYMHLEAVGDQQPCLPITHNDITVIIPKGCVALTHREDVICELQHVGVIGSMFSSCSTAVENVGIYPLLKTPQGFV